MRTFRLLLILLTASSFSLGAGPITQSQDYRDEIATLLKRLCPVEVNEPGVIVIPSPSTEAQQYVRERLAQIANESADSRSQVIEALIKVLEIGPSKEGMVAHRWTAAVYLLGELRATEAIDILVKNINQTGENGFVSSIHYRPVARALRKIGEPAIPRLIEALSDNEPMIQGYAASTLAEIGEPAFPKLEEALLSGGAESRVGAALALAWIGGEKARLAIERAIAFERDEVVMGKLKESLEEIYRLGRQ